MIGATPNSPPRGEALFPLASELSRPLPNGLAEGLVGGADVEPCGLRLALVTQEVNQTQSLTLRLQLWSCLAREMD